MATLSLLAAWQHQTAAWQLSRGGISKRRNGENSAAKISVRVASSIIRRRKLAA
jgi:hypothetical protein